MSNPSEPQRGPADPNDRQERDRDWNEDVPPVPPTEPEPQPVKEPPDSPGRTQGPYIAG